MCDTPFVKQVDTKHGLEVMEFPCGKCLPCKQNNKKQWIFRLEREQLEAEISTFVTLTYEAEHLPFSYTERGREILSIEPTLDYRDVQKFFKRLRKRHPYNKELPIKYFVVGEYGTENSRPHYHTIIFNAQEKDIVASWDKGMVHCGDVTIASITYCLNYMDKGSNPPPGS